MKKKTFKSSKKFYIKKNIFVTLTIFCSQSVIKVIDIYNLIKIIDIFS